MTVLASSASALTFLFHQNMNHEDILKEMHNKVHTCTLPNKLTIQVMICITMPVYDVYQDYSLVERVYVEYSSLYILSTVYVFNGSPTKIPVLNSGR